MQTSVVCAVYTACTERSIPSGGIEERLCFVFLISSRTDGTSGTGTGGRNGGCCECPLTCGQIKIENTIVAGITEAVMTYFNEVLIRFIITTYITKSE